MAKRTYYGVFQRGKLVETKDASKNKMPLVFLSASQARRVAAQRTKGLKKPNTVKAVTI